MNIELDGVCVICAKQLHKSDWEKQQVIALIGPEGQVVCCVEHVTDPAQYRDTVVKLGRAKANQITARDN